MTTKKQFRKNYLLTAAVATQESLEHLRQQLDAAEGDMHPSDYAAAHESLRRAENALTTIEQIANRIGAQR